MSKVLPWGREVVSPAMDLHEGEKAHVRARLMLEAKLRRGGLTASDYMIERVKPNDSTFYYAWPRDSWPCPREVCGELQDGA